MKQILLHGRSLPALLLSAILLTGGLLANVARGSQTVQLGEDETARVISSDREMMVLLFVPKTEKVGIGQFLSTALAEIEIPGVSVSSVYWSNDCAENNCMAKVRAELWRLGGDVGIWFAISAVPSVHVITSFDTMITRGWTLELVDHQVCQESLLPVLRNWVEALLFYFKSLAPSEKMPADYLTDDEQLFDQVDKPEGAESEKPYWMLGHPLILTVGSSNTAHSARHRFVPGGRLGLLSELGRWSVVSLGFSFYGLSSRQLGSATFSFRETPIALGLFWRPRHKRVSGGFGVRGEVGILNGTLEMGQFSRKPLVAWTLGLVPCVNLLVPIYNNLRLTMTLGARIKLRDVEYTVTVDQTKRSIYNGWAVQPVWELMVEVVLF